MTRKRQIEMWLLGAMVAGIVLALFVQEHRFPESFARASHWILGRVQVLRANSDLGTSDEKAGGAGLRGDPCPANPSDEGVAKELERKLNQEIAGQTEESSALQRRIRENEIHISLLLSRGYSEDSAAVTGRRTENEKYHAQIKGRQDAVRDLQERLCKVQSSLAKEQAHITQSYDPQMDRAWYLWEQRYGRKEDDLLEIGGNHGLERYDVHSLSSASRPEKVAEADQIVRLLSEEARELLSRDAVVSDAQLLGLPLAQYLRIPANDRRTIERALGRAQSEQQTDTSPYIGLVSSMDSEPKREHQQERGQ